MRLKEASGRLRKTAFRAWRAALSYVDGGHISAFGSGEGKIGMILIINLDRQPQRLRRTMRELRRFRTADGVPLTSLARRLSAIDARDGRAVAATADVDQIYRLRDQLYVQPDGRLEECFRIEEPVRMTRQEVAVAQSHVEAWKLIVTGPCDHVLVLEDDVWFRSDAAVAIEQGWNAAVDRQAESRGPKLLYLSYEDAGGTASRVDVCDALFRPERGLWFLSGYVLSRQGAGTLLRSMPVVGPVDMWINYRFDAMDALALNSPVILQRPDESSDNSYSALPFLARAGIVDSNKVAEPPKVSLGPVLAWTSGRDWESLPMALSMLGMRVRVFDGDERAISAKELPALLKSFDALVDVPITQCAGSAATARMDTKFIFESDVRPDCLIQPNMLPQSRTCVLSWHEASQATWEPICTLLGIEPPIQGFPQGTQRSWKMFRDDRRVSRSSHVEDLRWVDPMDDTPWTLLPDNNGPFRPQSDREYLQIGNRIVHAAMSSPSSWFPALVETFPGNLAVFALDGLVYSKDGADLVLSKAADGERPFRSGAFASTRALGHGRFEAEIRAARGSGVITGFFLHRDTPRQEIDVEILGDGPCSMLTNVYFNPGDDGATLGYGYRGTPCRIELGFDATLDFHRYAIDWRPGRISWSVDGRIVHERVGWEPTPIPHLPMRLHANVWAPRSRELAGQIDESTLPSTATFRNISVWI